MTASTYWALLLANGFVVRLSHLHMLYVWMCVYFCIWESHVDVVALTLTFCIQVQLVTCICMWVYKNTYIHTNVYVGALGLLFLFLFHYRHRLMCILAVITFLSLIYVCMYVKWIICYTYSHKVCIDRKYRKVIT